MKLILTWTDITRRTLSVYTWTFHADAIAKAAEDVNRHQIYIRLNEVFLVGECFFRISPGKWPHVIRAEDDTA